MSNLRSINERVCIRSSHLIGLIHRIIFKKPIIKNSISISNTLGTNVVFTFFFLFHYRITSPVDTLITYNMHEYEEKKWAVAATKLIGIPVYKNRVFKHRKNTSFYFNNVQKIYLFPHKMPSILFQSLN